MKIILKTICPEIVGALPNGEYEVPDGCGARDALMHCIAQYGGSDVKHDCLDHIIYMCGGRHIQPDHVLQDGERLMALRPAHGG